MLLIRQLKLSSKTKIPSAIKNVVVFGFDVAEISQIRRIRALRSLGYAVHSFTMRRDNMNHGFEPDWPNTHLYQTENENLLKRVGVIAKSVVKMAQHRKEMRRADVIVARNLDMLVIAWAARQLSGRGQTPLVYECLDINGSLCGPGRKARVMRWAERFFLRRVAMVVVSSPGFVREYFGPTQGYDGATALWENKLAAGAALPDRPNPETVNETQGPIRVGWVGTIRCAPSQRLLADLAEQAGRMGLAVEIHIHGVVHSHSLPEFDATIAAHDNMIFHGPYDYPGDLARIYGAMDVVWSQDLWQSGSNSDWLLPNRIYEASWAGCPSIAVATTETGRRIDEDHLGWTVKEPSAEALIRLLNGLKPEDISRRRVELLSRPAENFVQSPEDLQSVFAQIEAAQLAEGVR